MRQAPISLLGLLLATLAVLMAAAVARAAPPLRPGVWITAAETQRLPTRGPAWTALKALADRRLGTPRLQDQNSDVDVSVLAAALVYARTGVRSYADKSLAGVMSAIGTERGGRTLALARGLQSYVIAADLIDLKRLDPGKDRTFREWLRTVRTERLKPSDYPTLVATNELRPNNWGAHSGASRIAADVYLGDSSDLRRAAAVFKGYLGDRRIYHGFSYGADRSWQADAKARVGVNPSGAAKDGHSIDGALPDDMRRGCALKYPPCSTGYPWEALQGDVAQAEMLSRQGYDAWNWRDRALLRAVRFLYDLDRRYPGDGWAPSGDDAWIPWLINARYATHLPTTSPTQPGKGIGFADWTHAGARACHAPDCTAPLGARRAVAPIVGTKPGTGSVLAPLLIAAAAALGVVVALRKRGRKADRSARAR